MENSIYIHLPFPRDIFHLRYENGLLAIVVHDRQVSTMRDSFGHRFGHWSEPTFPLTSLMLKGTFDYDGKVKGRNSEVRNIYGKLFWPIRCSVCFVLSLTFFGTALSFFTGGGSVNDVPPHPPSFRHAIY